MKYCSKCGHELLDEAVVCVHCGCMVENNTSKVKKEKKKLTEIKAEDAMVILDFAFWILAIAAFTFYIIAIAQSATFPKCHVDLDEVDYWNRVTCETRALIYQSSGTTWTGGVLTIFSLFPSAISVYCAFTNKMSLKEKLSSILKIIVVLLLILTAAQLSVEVM